MRKRRYIFPLLFTHICIIVFHSPVYVYASRVFFEWGSSSPHSLSFHESFDPENFEKRHTSHTTQAKKKRLTAIVIFLLSFGTFLLLSDTHARASLCLSFRYQRKGDRVHPLVSRSIGARAFSPFSSLGKSWKDYYIYSRFMCARFARAQKKSPPKLSSASRDPSFFITTRDSKSPGVPLWEYDRKREREREIIFIFRRRRSAIDRSIDRLLRAFFFFAHKLSSYQQQLWKTGTFWAFDHTPSLNQERVFIPKRVFE